MSSDAMGNHKQSIDTTQDPCLFSLDSTFNVLISYLACSASGM
jgi:hypothetical protein